MDTLGVTVHLIGQQRCLFLGLGGGTPFTGLLDKVGKAFVLELGAQICKVLSGRLGMLFLLSFEFQLLLELFPLKKGVLMVFFRAIDLTLVLLNFLMELDSLMLHLFVGLICCLHNLGQPLELNHCFLSHL